MSAKRMVKLARGHAILSFRRKTEDLLKDAQAENGKDSIREDRNYGSGELGFDETPFGLVG
jgi:hypothetical protein